MGKHLVTTGLKETLRSDINNLLLGGWCTREINSDNPDCLNSEVIPYHWDSIDKLKKDEVYCNELYEILLAKVSSALNHLHGLDWPVRGWRIIIGPWLRRSITILFDRYECIRLATENYNISSVYCSESTGAELLSKDRLDFREKYISDIWNYNLFSRIIIETTKLEINIKNIVAPDTGDVEEYIKYIPKKRSIISHSVGIIRKYIKYLYNSTYLVNLINWLGKNNKYFIYIPYLPGKINEIKLNIKLSNFPITATLGNLFHEVSPDFIQRKSISIANEDLDDFGKVFTKILPDIIPIIYIEGFQKILEKELKATLPVHPRVIFTTIGIYVNEVVKVWMVKQILQGTKLVVGQHGGEYATSDIHAEPLSHELAVADYYLTWGWSFPGSHTIPSPALKLIGKKAKKWSKNGQLLIVNRHLPRYCEELSAGLLPGKRNSTYFHLIESLLEGLPDGQIGNTILRLHSFKNSGFENGVPIASKLRNKFPSLRISLSEQSLDELLASSKLTIFTYNGTTFLECMGLNTPCILVIDSFVEPISELAFPYYKSLQRVGIYHSTSQSAINHLSIILDDIEGWWYSHEVVSARNAYCEKFASTDRDALGKLANTIKYLAST